MSVWGDMSQLVRLQNRFIELRTVLALEVGWRPPRSSSCSSKSQMAAVKGKGVQQPPCPVVTCRTHSARASLRRSFLVTDLHAHGTISTGLLHPDGPGSHQVAAMIAWEVQLSGDTSL